MARPDNRLRETPRTAHKGATGIIRKPRGRDQRVVAYKPRRHRLGGVSSGGAVDDGGVGRMTRSTERTYRHPAVPSEPCFLSRVQTRHAGFPSSGTTCIRHLGPATIRLEGRNVLRLHAEFLR